jgi:transcription antitermination factor NusG
LSIQSTPLSELQTRPEFGLDQPCWFALKTRPRHEKRVVTELREKDLESFLPLRSSMHQWSDRRRLVHEPLFPGYVFVRITAGLNSRSLVLRTNGVVSFVGIRNMGVPIPNCEIEAIQTIVEGGTSFELHPYLTVGQRVCIRGGCLDGVSGVLMAINGDQSLIVSVNLIQRSIAMRVEGYKVEAL